MSKITTAEQFNVAFTPSTISAAMARTGISDLAGDNLWKLREACRAITGEYTTITIPGDDRDRFLHVSQDDPSKVAYTKNAEKGKNDIQTRTTLDDYCRKFGLNSDLAVRDRAEPVTVVVTEPVAAVVTEPVAAVTTDDNRHEQRIRNLVDDFIAAKAATEYANAALDRVRKALVDEVGAQ